MHNIQDQERDGLRWSLISSPDNPTLPNTAVTAFTIIFLVMMAIPAHLAVAMLLVVFFVICWQIGTMLNNTNKKVKHLETLLLISRADKKRIEMDETY